mmetsp:Transcript_4138/g.3463  ORF Transcript_4138/g.3463 Transcript_4138/m.3463 type:complete len:89 (+) Transcript_4138:14-280(+)
MLNKTNPFMNSSFSPKTVMYRSDGFGRDCYISKNCGGFSTIQDNPPTISNSINIAQYNKYAIRPGKFLVYRHNGSGRDTYIANNSGGF